MRIASLSRGAAIAVAVVALLPLQPASAGSAADPEITDPTGDANAVSVYRSDLTPDASVASFDITRVWFAGNGVVTIQLAGAVPPSGTFAVQFDTPGCVYPASEPLAVDVVDAHPGRGIALALDMKPPLYSTAFYFCNADPSWPQAVVPYRISGNTITFTFPANGRLKPGAPVISPIAYSALGFPYIDFTSTGRDAVL